MSLLLLLLPLLLLPLLHLSLHHPGYIILQVLVYYHCLPGLLLLLVDP